MKPLGETRTHYWLTQDMAKAVGVDLCDAFNGEELTQRDYADLVQSCRGCTCVKACQDWLDRLDPSERPAPGFCRNQALWEKLRPSQNP